MEFTHFGIKLSIGDAEVRRILLERLSSAASIAAPTAAGKPPRIGAQWDDQGGIYAGVVRGREGASDTYLIIGATLDRDITWDEGISYAKGLTDRGFVDWRLFYRPESAVAYANVPELFDGKVHWTCEQHAEDSGTAWYQNFSDGSQYYWSKDLKLRCRAVRSVIIQ